jgi:hypothetical protein
VVIVIQNPPAQINLLAAQRYVSMFRKVLVTITMLIFTAPLDRVQWFE